MFKVCCNESQHIFHCTDTSMMDAYARLLLTLGIVYMRKSYMKSVQTEVHAISL